MGDGTNLLAQIPAAYFLAYFIVPRFIYKQKYAEAFIYFIISGYIVCVLSRIEVIYVEEPFYGRHHKPKENIVEILTNLLKLVYVYFFRIFSVAFIFMFLKLLKDQLIIQKHTLTLEKEKAETELRLLKTQLNPHFLFNTLNNIYSLSLSNSPVTSASIGRLSEILDYILYRCNSLYVPLSGEISLLNNYIGLEKLRYDDRLKVNFKTSIEQDIAIAPLILVSIVENAFKHGAGDEIGNPTIDIDLNANENTFSFTISNSFTPMHITKEGVKIGLPNLKKQLELIYPKRHSLMVEQTDAFFTVTLTIDLKKARNEDKVLVG
jgi:LytS/YehU family sensor histidine kinase